MSPRLLTLLLLVALAAASGFAAWRLFGRYDPDADGAYRVTRVRITRDHGFYWVDIDLKHAGAAAAPLAGKIQLLTGGGAAIDPAAVGAPLHGGSPGGGPSLRFWLEAAQLEDTLTLVVGPDRLRIKASAGVPALGEGESRTQRRPNW